MVQWQDHPETDNSWMLSKDFVLAFPTFKLEDKLIFDKESIDTVHQTYYRKRSMPRWIQSTDEKDTEGIRVFAEEEKEEKDSIPEGGFAVTTEDA